MSMTPDQALAKLHELLALGRETEWVERKEARNDFSYDKLGQYFAALSNEANLHGEKFGWLILGVDDDGTIVDTQYRLDSRSLDSLKHEVAKNVSNRLSFVDIHTINIAEMRVLLFQIPPALRGIPTTWKGHYYGRDGESLAALNIEKVERIRKQTMHEDWTSGICEDATLEDLLPEAISKARSEYAKKNPRLTDELSQWDDITFLNKAMITFKGKITRAAIILLGRPESETFLHPSVATISWILKDADGREQDYEHFSPPLLLNVDAVYGKIRNLRYRHMPDRTLFPIEINQYDEWVFREALHNCIAHQDYTQQSKITLVEFPDRILFSNAGHFIPPSIEDVIERDAPEAKYRNPFLSRAMVNLNIIDTIGSGIRRMFEKQRERLFPLPEYNLKAESVSVTVMGKILDRNYVQHLSKNLGLSLHEVMLLDKVQKRIQISKKAAQLLRKTHLIEGRYPRLYISSQIAAISKQKAKYLHERGLTDQHYAELVIEHIKKFKSITRKEADELLFSTLPSILNEKQKKNKVHNILSLVLKGRIHNQGTRTKPEYVLNEDEVK